jgi:hypothetical protein
MALKTINMKRANNKEDYLVDNNDSSEKEAHEMLVRTLNGGRNFITQSDDSVKIKAHFAAFGITLNLVEGPQ